jgi:anti-sigma regulatory factor (Ser/Thr protein kinase)
MIISEDIKEVKMRVFNNYNHPNQDTIVNELIKGDLKKIENSTRKIRPEDITFDKFNVNAGSVDDLVRISNRIECKLKTYGVPTNKIQNLIIALGEAVNNAQQHGYQFAKDKMVVINLFKIGDNYFWVGIENTGEPIALSKIKSLLNENNPLKIGARSGRGYILMNNLVDVLYVSHYKLYTEVFLGIFKLNEMKN